ncbi:MAG TPA: hypothetical protein VHI78_09765, partial [Bacteroidales bacterium]|nr:hypothetical protein [Bacteroidales bacterium]
MRFMCRNLYINTIQVCLSLSFLFGMNLSGQETGFRVKGTVFSARTGLPIPEIGIRPVNASIEPVNTDSAGEFEILLPDANEQLQFSYPGYKDRLEFVNGRENITVWLLNENDVSLSDPVIMPFRPVSYNNIPGAVSASGTEVFKNSPASSFCQDLQGTVSGLNVTGRSGMPGEGSFIHSRGYSSIFSSSVPLVVVDGMIVRSEGFQDPIIHGYHNNPLVDLDKRDISSIVLLKDAVACGIYGIKGSNGVLLINTIPPQGGKTTLDVS